MYLPVQDVERAKKLRNRQRLLTSLNNSSGSPNPIPSLWIPFNDLGNGQVDITVVGGIVSGTFVRSTTAWTRLSSGLWTQVNSGVPRSYYTQSGRYGGFLNEGARINRCLWARDLTNAVWVSGGGGVTAAKTQVGIDGVSNSCSLITAAGADGTLLQSITSASATRTFSCHIKRSVGTGTLFMTLDNGTTWQDVTAQVGSGVFMHAQILQASVTNPIVGFKITTSGDAFIVDMCQEETGTMATTPMPTTSGTFTRSGDDLTYSFTALFNQTEGSIYSEVTPYSIATNSTPSRFSIGLHDGTDNERMYVGMQSGPSRLGTFFVVDGGVGNGPADTANSLPVDIESRIAVGYKLNDCLCVVNGGIPTADTSVTVPTVTTLSAGSARVGTANLYGGTKNLKYFNRRLSNSELTLITRAPNIPILSIPFADLGNGQVDTTASVVGGWPFSAPVASFSRASVAWTRKADGFWTQVGTGVARSYYLANGVYAGFLSEQAITNRCLWSRDFTNVAWTTSGITALKNQIGLDNVPSSCSLLTASSANGTILQSITNGLATRTFSIFIKRVTGNGAIAVTLDNGSTWTDVTSLISSDGFFQVSAAQALANPTVGIRISVSGDAIAVDMAQEETGSGCTTPMPTTSSAVTRNTDSLQYTLGNWFNYTEGSMTMSVAPYAIIFNAERAFCTIHDTTVNERIQLECPSNTYNADLRVVDGGVTQATVTPTGVMSQSSITKVGAAWGTNNFQCSLARVLAGPDTSGSLPTPTTICIGGRLSGSASFYGSLKDFKFFNYRLGDPQLQEALA